MTIFLFLVIGGHMPAKFSPEEMKMIQSQLLIEARKLFETQGFHKTSIDQLVNAVGIAKGSFYKFFENKESLYFDILDNLEVSLHQKAIKHLRACQDIRNGLKSLVVTQMEEMMHEPLLSASMDTNFFLSIWKRLPESKKKQSEMLDINKMHAIEAVLLQKNYTLCHDFKTSSGIFRSLVFTLLHKEMMGQNHAEITEFYLDTILNHMIKPIAS